MGWLSKFCEILNSIRHLGGILLQWLLTEFDPTFSLAQNDHRCTSGLAPWHAFGPSEANSLSGGNWPERGLPEHWWCWWLSILSYQIEIAVRSQYSATFDTHSWLIPLTDCHDPCCSTSAVIYPPYKPHWFSLHRVHWMAI